MTFDSFHQDTDLTLAFEIFFHPYPEVDLDPDGLGEGKECILEIPPVRVAEWGAIVLKDHLLYMEELAFPIVDVAALGPYTSLVNLVQYAVPMSNNSGRIGSKDDQISCCSWASVPSGRHFTDVAQVLT